MPFALWRFLPGFFWLTIAAGILFFAPRLSISVQAVDYSYTPIYSKFTKTLDWEEKIATFSIKPKPTTPAPKKITVVNYPVPTDLDAVFASAAQTYGVDKNLLTKIAKCESNFHSTSVNPDGPYLGMFQYLESTWISTRKQMGADPNPSLVFDAEEAIKTSAWKIAHNGLNSWPVCGK